MFLPPRISTQRSLSSAALSSSIWLVCRKCPRTARPGWDNAVLREMQVVQAVLELAKPGTDERATLEYIQNHLAGDGGAVVARQRGLLDG